MIGGGNSRKLKKKKKDMRVPCFERMEIFLIKYGLESYVFFLENGSFLKKYGLKSNDFFIKNNKKRHLFVFLVHNKLWL